MLGLLLAIAASGSPDVRHTDQKRFEVITRRGVDGKRGGVQRLYVEARTQNDARALAESLYGGKSNISDVRQAR